MNIHQPLYLVKMNRDGKYFEMPIQGALKIKRGGYLVFSDKNGSVITTISPDELVAVKFIEWEDDLRESLLSNKSKILGIKLLRQLTGLGIQEAKEAVEAYANSVGIHLH